MSPSLYTRYYSKTLKDFKNINFAKFTRSINCTWSSPNWFKRCPCFFRFVIRRNKPSKNIFDTFFLVDSNITVIRFLDNDIFIFTYIL